MAQEFFDHERVSVGRSEQKGESSAELLMESDSTGSVGFDSKCVQVKHVLPRKIKETHDEIITRKEFDH